MRIALLIEKRASSILAEFSPFLIPLLSTPVAPRFPTLTHPRPRTISPKHSYSAPLAQTPLQPPPPSQLAASLHLNALIALSYISTTSKTRAALCIRPPIQSSMSRAAQDPYSQPWNSNNYIDPDTGKDYGMPPTVLAEGLDKLTLDQLIDSIVRCDDEYCPEYEYVFLEGIERVLKLKFPTIAEDLDRCNEEMRQPRDCMQIFEQGMVRASPIFSDMCNQKRLRVSQDPLLNYHGAQYAHPFWFEGVGEIWRRVSHGSRRVTVKDCQRLMRESERCLADKTRPNDECFRLYAEAAACESGTICSYLRMPILSCISKQEDDLDYNALQACYDNLSNFRSCKTSYVTLTPEAFDQLGLDSLDV